MKIFALTCLLFFSVSTPGVLANMNPKCPVQALGETTEDCPWADIARILSQPEITSPEAVVKKLQEISPALFQGMVEDRSLDILKNLWGMTQNYDELAKGEIGIGSFPVLQ